MIFQKYLLKHWCQTFEVDLLYFEKILLENLLKLAFIFQRDTTKFCCITRRISVHAHTNPMLS